MDDAAHAAESTGADGVEIGAHAGWVCEGGYPHQTKRAARIPMITDSLYG